MKASLTIIVIAVSSAFTSYDALLASNSMSQIPSNNLCSGDGTQLVSQTKQLVANYYNVSIFLVSASYIGQTLAGTYEYSYSVFGGNSGTVEWQIIGDDFESFLY